MFDGEVLVIGLGSIGERHVRNLLALGHTRISVLRRAAKKPRTLQGTEFTTLTDIDAAFQRDPAAVIIGTPSASHTEHLSRAIDKGIPVLIEVPISHEPDRLDSLVQQAEARRCPTLVGHNLRFHPALAAIKTAISKGHIGRPLYSRSQFGEYLPDCHPWEDYKQRYEGRRDLGGGAILTSIHEIDHAYWLLGPFSTVSAVSAQGILGTDVDEISMMIFEHASGALSEVELDFVQRTYRRSLQVCGTEGTLEWALLDDHVSHFDAAKKIWSDLMRYPEYDINQCYIDELKHFAEVIRGETPALNTLADGVHVLKAGLGAQQAAREGRRISIEAPITTKEPVHS